MLNQVRQWASCISEVSPHHLIRYEFAVHKVFGRILDAACGSGYGSWLIFSQGGNVVGVDSSKKAILWAREFFPGPLYLQGRIEESPWRGNFDSVVSFETIEHVKEPQILLAKLRVSCKGKFIASVPNEEQYQFRSEDFANDECPHFRHYTPKEFDDLLEKAGFKVLERYTQLSKFKPAIVEGTSGKFLIYVCE